MEHTASVFPSPFTTRGIPSPSKRSRKEGHQLSFFEVPGMVYPSQNSHGASQAWKKMRDARRASLTYLMDCGASPITLDCKIDRRIFDFTPMTFYVPRDDEKAAPNTQILSKNSSVGKLQVYS